MSGMTKYKLYFTVPQSHLTACKEAIFAVGAGSYPGSGGYTKCAFMTRGTGQFAAGKDAKPAIGTAGGGIETVDEIKVETLCVGEDVCRAAVAALKKRNLFKYLEPWQSLLEENTEKMSVDGV